LWRTCARPAPVLRFGSAAQVHPVVARLCAPIEGTDAARLADCLGLDAARFHAAAAAAAGAGARGAADDALLGAAASLDDDARYSVRGRRHGLCVQGHSAPGGCSALATLREMLRGHVALDIQYLSSCLLMCWSAVSALIVY